MKKGIRPMARSDDSQEVGLPALLLPNSSAFNSPEPVKDLLIFARSNRRTSMCYLFFPNAKYFAASL